VGEFFDGNRVFFETTFDFLGKEFHARVERRAPFLTIIQ
jgi:hypothetical protein